MRRSPAWRVGFGVLLVWAVAPAAAPAADGFWVTLAAGMAGSDSSSAANEFWFDSPHGPPIAVNAVPSGATAEAGTGGGTVFFSGAGTPVLLNTSNGSAYIASSGAPDAAKAASGKGAAAASAAPSAGGALPTDAALLGLKLADPDSANVRALTASVTDPNGNPLGSGSVGVPDGGWWVVGLSPGATTTPTPDPGPVVDPAPTPTPDPVPTPGPLSGSGGTVTTPEPATMVMAGLGTLTVAVWRTMKRRKAGESASPM